MTPKIIQGKNHSDYRGEVAFVNDFDFSNIKRFYTITNTSTNQFRAWQGHRLDNKNFYCVAGSFDIYFVKIDNWDNPSKDLKIKNSEYDKLCTTISIERPLRYVAISPESSLALLPVQYKSKLSSSSNDRRAISKSVMSCISSIKT